MCGIIGIFSENPSVRKTVEYLNEKLKHRGPDDEGYVFINTKSKKHQSYCGNDSVEPVKQKLPHISNANFNEYDLVFGQRRLSIIDLSENGHCPMSDESGKIWITYNGEIYNYIELREELKSYGYSFRTGSDTEVIIKAYQKWGEDCFKRFNGMWAFALWDSDSGKLILSRDRFGIKPLYFVNSDGLFAFSSEIKPLIHLIPHGNIINDKLMPFFILYGNRFNQEETYIRNIQTLKASHYMVYQNGSVEIKRYYKIPVAEKNTKTEAQLKRELIELFSDSVKLRFRSDVKVGTCLSGGFDSSGIVAISNRVFGPGLNTFSAVWSYEECDESKYIDIVNNEYGCIPNKIEPSANEFESTFEKLCYFQEVPTEGPGLYPQWYVMQKAKGKVKVLLDGQGGDEVFGGYFNYGTYLRSLIKDKKLKDILANRSLFLRLFRNNGTLGFSNWLFPDFYNKFFRVNFSKKFKVLDRDILSRIKRKELYHDITPPEIYDRYLNNLSYHYISNLTIPALLHYEDRSSMAHSIESRVPFLDYRLVEFGINLPPECLAENNTTRPLYRRAFRELLPPQIIARKDKLGFPAPFDIWTRSNIKEYVMDILTNPNALLYNYINKKYLDENLSRHFREEINYGWYIWRLLSFEKFLNLVNKIQASAGELVLNKKL